MKKGSVFLLVVPMIFRLTKIAPKIFSSKYESILSKIIHPSTELVEKIATSFSSEFF